MLFSVLLFRQRVGSVFLAPEILGLEDHLALPRVAGRRHGEADVDPVEPRVAGEHTVGEELGELLFVPVFVFVRVLVFVPVLVFVFVRVLVFVPVLVFVFVRVLVFVPVFIFVFVRVLVFVPVHARLLHGHARLRARARLRCACPCPPPLRFSDLPSSRYPPMRQAALRPMSPPTRA